MTTESREPERKPAVTRTVRFVVRQGCLEPLEPVNLVEGMEFEALIRVVKVPGSPAEHRDGSSAEKTEVNDPGEGENAGDR